MLQVLERHGAEIEEYEVDSAFLERLDRSALSKDDLEALENSKPRRPSLWHDYIDEKHFKQAHDGTLWHDEFPSVIPFAVVDPRIMDLALDFWTNPDSSLLDGYRRLEDIVRERTGITRPGTGLFSQAFNPDGGALTWKDADGGELAGRMQLFTGTYAAHRNPRAHREPKGRSAELLREFLLLNHLYALEPVINFRVGVVAHENRFRRGGIGRLWRDHSRGFQRSMNRFTPQPEGLGPIFPISSSLVARRYSIFVAPRSLN